MKTRSILIALIEHLDEFGSVDKQSSDLSLSDFVDFLNEKLGKVPAETRKDSGGEAPWLEEMGEETEAIISRLVVVMNRYAKSYIKRALQDSVIQTGEEFSFMLYLLSFGSLTKTELIYKNILEKTSGMEVIKRLNRLGLIEESNDENDKRSKRITLTPKGRNELLRILPIMQKVTHLVSGNLTLQERKTLAYLLNKLDHYHHEIFTNDRQTSFGELSAKYATPPMN